MNTSHNMQAIILAAGQSKRFGTGISKLVTPLCGRPLILYSIDVLTKLNIPTTVVVGFQKEIVTHVIDRIYPHYCNFITQEEQWGTGNALAITQSLWSASTIVVINGDMPFLTDDTISKLYTLHHQNHAAVTFVSAYCIDNTAFGYGRVVEHNNQIEIVEARHFTATPTEYPYVNAGIYVFDKSFLIQAITLIDKNPVTAEWYLTDLIKIASRQGYLVKQLHVPFQLIQGINTVQEFVAAEKIMQRTIIEQHMTSGVLFFMPETNKIDHSVRIGSGTVINAGVHIQGDSSVGKECIIKEYSSITDSTIGDHAVIKQHSIIEKSCIMENVHVGPFAHIHTHSIINQESVVGNFVEIKHAHLHPQAKAKHLAYIGDAHIGKQSNIGAGVVISNYDGNKKHMTIIGDYAFIGSNSTLVSPITIDQYAFIGAGSTITHNVPAHALAIARSYQTNKEAYNKKLRPQLYNTILDQVSNETIAPTGEPSATKE